MAKPQYRMNRRTIFNSYFTTTLSTTMVLFMLGLMGVLLLSANKLSNYVRENIGFSIIIDEKASEPELLKLQKYLDATPYVKSTHLITKEEAANEFKKELGEDFVTFIGYNPLQASIEVKLFANYANSDSLAMIENMFLKNSMVKEVVYQKNLVSLVNDNVNKITSMVLLFSIVLLLISIALINNTIRLMIYSKRFLINTMQLVGATNAFIRRPFVNSSILSGFIASLIAIAILSAIIFNVKEPLNSVISINDIEVIGMVYAGMMLGGIIISHLSAFFAVTKYLRLRTNDLYY